VRLCSLGARSVTFGRNGQIIDQPVTAPSDRLVFPASLSPSPSPTVRKSWRAPLRLRVCHKFDGQAREENERLREEFKRRITIAFRCDRQYGGDAVLGVARLRSDQQVQGSNSRHAWQQSRSMRHLTVLPDRVVLEMSKGHQRAEKARKNLKQSRKIQ
jgi:hypothetical protein